MSSKFDTFYEELTQTKAELRTTYKQWKHYQRKMSYWKEIMDLQQYTGKYNVLFGVPDSPDESVY